MKEIILVKYGEMVLKGLNKKSFEDMLTKNIKRRLKNLGQFKITSAQSTTYITPVDENIDLDEVVDKSETQLIGVVPDDYRLVSFSQTGKPNLNNSISKEVFDRIADRLTGKNLQLAFPKKF